MLNSNELNKEMKAHNHLISYLCPACRKNKPGGVFDAFELAESVVLPT